MVQPGIPLEVVVESVADALAAEAGGADRLELCSALSEGGLTPGPGLLAATLERSRLPVMVMVRPRGGDFLYDDTEFDTMKREVLAARQSGAAGVVFGLLCTDGAIDVERTRELIALAGPLQVTFHRAFDHAVDQAAALEQLIGLGVGRVLTSGGQDSALAGKEVLRRLVEQAAGRIAVMAAAGIRAELVQELVTATGVPEVHVSASGWRQSAMQHRSSVPMGSNDRPGDARIRVTDREEVARVRAALHGLADSATMADPGGTMAAHAHFLTELEGSLDPADLGQFLQRLLREFQCAVGTVHLLDQKTGMLTLSAHIGLPEQLLPVVGTIPIGKGMAGIAAERREAVQVCNLQTDSSGVVRSGAKMTRMEGSVACPMLIDGRLHGVLGVAKPVAYEFTRDEVRLLMQVGERLARRMSALEA